MLGLSTADEPLKAWVDKTSEAAGVRIVENNIIEDENGGSSAEDARAVAVAMQQEEKKEKGVNK